MWQSGRILSWLRKEGTASVWRVEHRVFVLVRIIILLNPSPTTKNTSITLIKEDPFFFLRVMGLPTILNPD